MWRPSVGDWLCGAASMGDWLYGAASLGDWLCGATSLGNWLCGAASLGDWFPTFRLVMAPRPRRTEALTTAALRNTNQTDRLCAVRVT